MDKKDDDAKNSPRGAINKAERLSWIASKIYKHVEFSASKTWQDGGVFRHPKEVFTPALTNGFPYSPLPTPSSIRLLEIKPGGPSERIRCSLQTVDLLDSPNYRALSYTWQLDPASLPYQLDFFSRKMPKAVTNGAAKLSDAINEFMVAMQNGQQSDTKGQEKPEELRDRDKILCNGKGVFVSPNLYRALLQLRRSCPGYYWIDAICMNQSDPIERSQQVQMMGRIYSSAAQVTVWLGACPLLLSPGVSALQDSIRTGLPEPSDSANPKEIFANKDGDLSIWHIALCALFILTRRWFRRLWVLQELCLAKEAIFFLGEHQFGPNDVSTALIWINDILKSQKLKSYTMLRHVISVYRDTAKQGLTLLDSRQTITRGNKIPLEKWLELSRYRKASNPRDMIYGGLSVIQPETLVIDQDLRSCQQAPPLPARPGNPSSLSPPALPPRPSAQGKDDADKHPSGVQVDRLWPKVRVDYDISIPGLLLNLAACLLSRSNAMDLLSISTRYRKPYFYDVSRDAWFMYLEPDEDKIVGSGEEIPSWYPITWSTSAQVFEPLIWKSKALFTFTSPLKNNPLISPDGRSLYLDAAELDTIEECILTTLYGDWMNDMELETIHYISGERIAEKRKATLATYLELFQPSPPFHILQFAVSMSNRAQPTGQHPLETLCDIFTAGIWDSGVYSSVPTTKQKVIGFCQYLDDFVRHHVTAYQDAQKKIEAPEAKNLMQRRGTVIDKLQADYSMLKATYPDQPWPDPDRNIVSEESRKLAMQFARAQQSAQRYRSIFKTGQGSLVLGPAWAMEGDVIMLVKGGKVPYIFTPRDEHLQRQIVYLEQFQSDPPDDTSSQQQSNAESKRWDIEELRRAIGGKMCYMLTGEAYVEGLMHGEILRQEMNYERIEIV